MCGITGIIKLGDGTEFQTENIWPMTKTIRHRGPDDEGYLLYNGNTACIFGGDDTNFEEQSHAGISYFPKKHIANSDGFLSQVAFGFRRLSIIDLFPSGHQPMSYMNRYWIVFNGEIYNYLELKAELENVGYIFNSKTDTEVIMAAYDNWGTGCLNKFNGMWAFVILDTLKNTLFIGRDRFGIKPLYYYQDEDKFIFASEIKAILAHSKINTNPNLRYVKDYLLNGSKAYLKETAFENIYNFSPASFLEITIDDLAKTKVKEKRFWILSTNLEIPKFSIEKANEYSEKYYDLLKDSVRLRMRADVKIGSALSGGLDSSTIVHLVNSNLKDLGKEDQQVTFSNTYSLKEQKDLDESEFIQVLIDHLNVKSFKTEPKVKEIPEQIYQVIYMMDNPPDGTAMSGWYVYKCVARTDIKVTLDGQGADEQLAGYLSYFYNFLTNIPLLHAVKEYFKLITIPKIDRKSLILALAINLCKTILGMKITKEILRKLKKNNKILLNLNELLVSDTSNELMTLLHYGDRLSMAHSIESRVPFMDYRLVEYIANLPLCYKIHLGWSKYIARLAMKDFLPGKIVWRKDKMAFPNADQFWFNGELKNWFVDKIKKSEFIKQITEINSLEEKMNSPKSFNKIVRLMILSIWFEIFFIQKKYQIKD